MNRFDIINKIGDKYHVGNTDKGEFSYSQALKSVDKDIKDYQKGTSGTQHQYLDIRFENERLAVLIETKNKFSKWDKTKIQTQLQDYVRFEKAYSGKKIVAILAETDGDEVWVWYGQSVIIDDEHRIEEEAVLRPFEEYENLCFGRVNDKIKVVDSIKTLNEKLHSDGINEKLRSQFVGTCLLALKNGLVYKDVKETLVKIVNPITKLTNKKSVVFSTTADDKLDLITDDVYRLYLTVDFIVYDGAMYTFNHTFEAVFNLEKTMAKVKQIAIDEILNTNAFSDSECFRSLATQYKSSRTFITLKQKRINKIKDKRGRKKIADMLKLPLDENGNFSITTSEEASLLLRYLCFKIFQDNETKDILEANTVTKLSIA